MALGTKISADESHAYNALDGYYQVGRINHSQGEYSVNGISTNGIGGILVQGEANLHRDASLVEHEAHTDVPGWLRLPRERGTRTGGHDFARYGDGSRRGVAIQGVDRVTLESIIGYTQPPYLDPGQGSAIREMGRWQTNPYTRHS